ncbi:MAG: hypothetical protein OXC28_07230 [Defluviicoccus sp.]|nr:hypothetical protein [Defluviicoccus sp.]
MARAMILLAAIACAGCAGGEPAAVRLSVAICPETPPALTCPDLPGGAAAVSLADLLAALGDCRAVAEAWEGAHASCRERTGATR